MKNAMNLRIITIGLSCIILIGMITFTVYRADFRGDVVLMVSFIPFSLFYAFPLIVSIMLSVYTRNSFSQIILLMASLLYGIWFAYAVYDAFYVNTDPQSGLVLIFVGIYALPVLLPLWITAYVLNRRYARKQKSQV